MGAEQEVTVDCPACGRRHHYAPRAYACACGAPVAPPLTAEARPEAVPRRSWTDEWVVVRCAACGRDGHWPQPEVDCPCGTMLRIPVRLPGHPVPRDWPPHDWSPRPSHIPLPRTAAAPRPAFRPLTIRTARDAVTAAGLYLRWLGYHGVVAAEQRPESGIDLRGPEVVAQVDPTTTRTPLRAVECVWLYGMQDAAVGVLFSLAGYADDARARADELGVPLFVMDLTGTPQPVNAPADDLLSSEV
ncbi:hypothetical protein [Streptomyces montanisoli]|uniref:Restriction endonuclease type IV Mrr domain-containing protein n=1 Tax=Streptomyces montanisoli TaxID=2798581 RepID=A0A940MEF5_9ACTN|nr:hypothetical protein [Streptomyces montanisoli]MBP0458495.1 hypothetical protein [Streptomyces montanisoli]